MTIASLVVAALFAAASPIAEPIAIQGRLTAAEARTIDVTADTWRLVLEQLDDVYTDPEVSAVRGEAMRRFAEAMAATDKLDSWQQRSAAREAARRDLLQSLQEITQIREDAADHDTAREAALAYLEGMVALGQAETAIKSARALLDTDDELARRAQAYRLAIRAAQLVHDIAVAGEFQRAYALELPAMAKLDASTAPPFGVIRVAIRQLQRAQAQDDLALKYQAEPRADPKIVEQARQIRDAARTAAAMTLELRQFDD